MILDLQPCFARDSVRDVAGEIESNRGRARAQAGVDPDQRGRHQSWQPSVHLLSDQPGRSTEPLLRRPRKELQVGGHRAVSSQQRVSLALGPRSPRRLAGIRWVVVFQPEDIFSDGQQTAGQGFRLRVAENQDIRAGADRHGRSLFPLDDRQRQVVVETPRTFCNRMVDEAAGGVFRACRLKFFQFVKQAYRAIAQSASHAVSMQCAEERAVQFLLTPAVERTHVPVGRSERETWCRSKSH